MDAQPREAGGTAAGRSGGDAEATDDRERWRFTSACSGELYRTPYGALREYGVKFFLYVGPVEHFNRPEPTTFHVHDDETALRFEVNAVKFGLAIVWRSRRCPGGDDVERSTVRLPTLAAANDTEAVQLGRQFRGLGGEKPFKLRRE